MMKTLGAASVVALGLLTAAPAYADVVEDGDFTEFAAPKWSISGTADVSSAANGFIADGSIFQTFNAVAGQLYSLTVNLGKTPLATYGTSNYLAVRYAGILLGEFTAATLPTTLTTNFTGISGAQFRVTGVTDSTNGGLFTVDDVTVTAVPGPLAGAGLPVVAGMIAYGAWRRRKAIAA